jgi:hypothetical protein
MRDADSIRKIQATIQKAKASGLYTHKVPKNAMVTGLGIPLALGALGTTLLVKGYYNMMTGTGKL